MTREELIDRLIAWNPPDRWVAETFRRRDDLQFALWWYGASTEATKADPGWPNADYVKEKTGGGPRYLYSINMALSLIPLSFNWILGKGKMTEAEPLYGVQIIRGTDDVVAEAENDSAPLAICIAAIRARAALARANAKEAL
jgi:hypothetical protein